MRIPGLVRIAAILALCPISLGHAQSPADFYKGKTIDLYIGYSAGGGYDVYARALVVTPPGSGPTARRVQVSWPCI